MPEDGFTDPFKELRLSRSSVPTDAVYGVATPSLCVIAQGSKEVGLGGKQYKYDPYHYLLATVELPVVSRIVDASKERPYLGFRMTIDTALVGSVLVEMGQLGTRTQEDAKAITVSSLDSNLLDAVLRMVRLLDSPAEARILLPLVSREIVYRLLRGEQGDRLRHMTVPGGHTHRISQAVERICREYSQPLHVEELARQIGMSVSGFHHHFKSVTAMSPLQFQKQLRLTEARRLMLGESLDAATAGYRVGYDDASHFNREYKRLFGEPPIRDVERLREAIEANADV
jgi:AraC-like DNA-binding protein